MHDLILKQLDAEDDAELWQDCIGFRSLRHEPHHEKRQLAEIGRCSHWLRPHQTRWTADGGFASPTGYGGVGYSRTGLPLFDWSVLLEWTGEEWAAANKKSAAPSLRVTIPSRTKRHQQAAVHTLWTNGRVVRRYGFRKKADGWRLTAVSQPSKSQVNRKSRYEEKDRGLARKKQRREKGEV